MLTVRLDSESFEDDEDDDVSRPYDQLNDNDVEDDYQNDTIEKNRIIMEKWLMQSNEIDQALASLGISSNSGDRGDNKPSYVLTKEGKTVGGISKTIFVQDIPENDMMGPSKSRETEEDGNKQDRAKSKEVKARMSLPKFIRTMQHSSSHHKTDWNTDNVNNKSNSGKHYDELSRLNHDHLHYLRDEVQVDFHTAIKSALRDHTDTKFAKKRNEQQNVPKKMGFIKEARKNILGVVSCLTTGEYSKNNGQSERDSDKTGNARDRRDNGKKTLIQQFLDGAERELKFVFNCGDETCNG